MVTPCCLNSIFHLQGRVIQREHIPKDQGLELMEEENLAEDLRELMTLCCCLLISFPIINLFPNLWNAD